MKKFMSIFMTFSMLVSMGNSVFAMGITKVGALDAVLGKILGVVQAIGYAFATGMLLYIGIKYMMASANEKADLKKGSINYVIGAVIIFGCSALIGIFTDLSTQVVGEQ